MCIVSNNVDAQTITRDAERERKREQEQLGKKGGEAALCTPCKCYKGGNNRVW